MRRGRHAMPPRSTAPPPKATNHTIPAPSLPTGKLVALGPEERLEKTPPNQPACSWLERVQKLYSKLQFFPTGSVYIYSQRPATSSRVYPGNRGARLRGMAVRAHPKYMPSANQGQVYGEGRLGRREGGRERVRSACPFTNSFDTKNKKFTLSNVRKVSLRSSTSSSVRSLIASASDTAILEVFLLLL